MGKVADLSVFTPGGQPGAPNPSEGLAALRQNQTAFMETIGVMLPEALTIVDGAISPTTAVCIVDTEGGAPADDLTTINATLSDGSTLHDGMVILLSAKDASRVVTVKNSDAPNGVKTVDGKDIVLSPEWCLVLQYVGGVWQQINVSAPLKPATETTLGGVKVGDGLTIRDGVMSADLATDAEAGRVKASEGAKAGAVPLGGIDGKLDNSWLPFMLLNSRLVITESNASWAPPVTGWARICVIGGGGGGAGGGRSEFGAAGGGGGGSGEEVLEFRYLDMQERYSAVIGAGGAHGGPGSPGTDGGKTQFADISAAGGGGGKVGSGGFGGGTNPLTCGYPGSVDVQILSVNTAQQKTLYGGGGGRGASPVGNTPIAATGYGAGGHGGYGVTAPYPTDPVAGGDGVQGCIIIEYYDKSKEGA